jgi:carboxypeptidase family protein/TonB-dependent receptor-like protein
MRRAILLLALLGLCTSMLLVPTPASAQAVYGSIFGTVTDPQGAAVAGAKVTVTNVRKGTTDETTTNASGNYNVTHLIPDVYTVKAEASGFKPFEATNITVSADTSLRLDGQFSVGGATETVEVTAEAPQLKTDRADVATLFNERAVENLPVYNRNFTEFELLSPGTQKLVGWTHAKTENPQGSQQIFVNGQHFSGTAYELDGTDNQDPILGIIVVNPNLDAVTETKITTQNYDAEFGKAIAGVVSTQTKSGSNDYHGSAFFFRRSDATEARNPFTQFQPDPITGRLIPTDLWAQFGGSFGGAIIKDKLFFFGDYQGTRRKTGRSLLKSVPTDLVRQTCLGATGNCDLSEYLNGGQNQIFDPTTGNPDGTGRAAFAGNLIPVGKLSQEAVALLAQLPAPNVAGAGTANNFVGAGSGTYDDNTFDIRIDHQTTQKIHTFGRFSRASFNLAGTGVFGVLGGEGIGPDGLNGNSKVTNYSLASGFDYALSSTLLTDFRFGWFHYGVNANKNDFGQTPAADFGLAGLNLDDSSSGLPGFFIDRASGGDNGLSFGEGLDQLFGRCNCPLTQSEHQIQFVNNWTKISGNHQFKFGADIRRAWNLRVPSDANRAGQLTFHQFGTSNAGAGGLGLATFLMGDVTNFSRYVSTSTDAAERQKRFFFYGQDTWRVTNKLTVNYGVRWEIYFPETVNGAGKGGFADLATGTIRVAGFGGFGTNGNIENTYKAFAPRIGVAYQVNPKTVVRMGYGRSFDIGVFGSIFGHTVTQNLPVLVNQNLNGTGDNHTAAFLLGPGTQTTATTTQVGPTPFPFPCPQCGGTIPSDGLIPFADGENIKVRPTRMRLPTLDAWNITIQREITPTISAEVGYVGNHGSHVFAGNGPGFNVNQATVVGFPGVPFNQRRLFHNAFSNPAPDGSGPVVCCDGDLTFLGNNASNNYNALQAKINKRFSKGLQFLAHYTWSKALNYNDEYFPIDAKTEYGRDDFNRDHVFVFNTVYELPFGKGKQFGTNAGRAMDLIIGGWQTNWTLNWSSGLPWTPSYSQCGADRDTGPCRPDLAGSFDPSPGDFDPVLHQVVFFTPVAPLATNGATSGPFGRPQVGTFGNTPRNAFTGPSFFGANMSLMKNFNITERFKGQFRMDAFNVFNHPVYGFSSTAGNRCIDCQGSDAGLIKDIENGTTMRQLQFGLRFTF